MTNEPGMLVLRLTHQGEEYVELNREFPGGVTATKNHQDGLDDVKDESPPYGICEQLLIVTRSF